MTIAPSPPCPDAKAIRRESDQPGPALTALLNLDLVLGCFGACSFLVQPINCLPHFRRLWSMRQYLQITFVLGAGIVQNTQFFQTYGQPDGRHRIVVFVAQGLAVARLGGAIVLALEIKVAHLYALRRPVRIPGVELAHT